MNLDGEFFRSCLEVGRGRRVASPDIPKDVPEEITDESPGAWRDFVGFPSLPISIHRTGPEWPINPPPKAYRIPRQVLPVCKHPIQAVWLTLGEKIYKLLDSLGVRWTTIDPGRFTDAEKRWEADSLYIWIGVLPRSLSVELAKIAAVSCKDILAAANFSDIEISFRESFFTLSAPPTLLNHTERCFDPTADLRSPFTGVLGIAIAHKKAAPVEGMGTLYICEGGECNRVSLLTARHVALPSSMHRNDLYIFDRIKSSLLRPRIRHQVLILGPQAYSNAIRDMVGKIGSEVSNLERYKRLLSQLGEAPADENVSTVSKSRRTYKERLDKAERTLVGVDALHSEITKNWTVVEQRVLGHVVYAPPISVATDPKQFTEDWALVERDCVKIDWDDFKGNALYIDTFFEDIYQVRCHLTGTRRKSFRRRVSSATTSKSRGS